MFQALTCPSSGGQIVFTQHLVSSLSVNGCTVHWLRADIKVCKWNNFNSIGNVHRCLDTIHVLFTLLSCFYKSEQYTSAAVRYTPQFYRSRFNKTLSDEHPRQMVEGEETNVSRSISVLVVLRRNSFPIKASYYTHITLGMFLIHHGAANQDTRWKLHLYQHRSDLHLNHLCRIETWAGYNTTWSARWRSG